MHEFFIKYAENLNEDDAFRIIEKKLKRAMKYFQNGNELKSYQCLNEISLMINDLIELKKI